MEIGDRVILNPNTMHQDPGVTSMLLVNSKVRYRYWDKDLRLYYYQVRLGWSYFNWYLENDLIKVSY